MREYRMISIPCFELFDIIESNGFKRPDCFDADVGDGFMTYDDDTYDYDHGYDTRELVAKHFGAKKAYLFVKDGCQMLPDEFFFYKKGDRKIYGSCIDVILTDGAEENNPEEYKNKS